jgi:hypothetical protein
MCVPLVVVGMAAAVAAAGVSAYGQVRSSNYQAKVAEQNAQIQENAGALALQRGAIAAGVERMKESQAEGSARAAMGGSGIDLQSGSSLDVLADSRMMNELDAQTVANNAAREAWGYKTAAVNDRAQAELSRMSGRYGAAATLIGGAAQATSMWSGYKSASMGTRGTTSGALA